MAWREQLLRLLAAMDGLFIIDSDPVGYPGSTNLEFVYLLGAHRRVLDRLRPGVELIYWAHLGWESHMKKSVEEPQAAVVLLAGQPGAEAWSVADSGFSHGFLDAVGHGERVLGFPYGTVEAEPSWCAPGRGTCRSSRLMACWSRSEGRCGLPRKNLRSILCHPDDSGPPRCKTRFLVSGSSAWFPS